MKEFFDNLATGFIVIILVVIFYSTLIISLNNFNSDHWIKGILWVLPDFILVCVLIGCAINK